MTSPCARQPNAAADSRRYLRRIALAALPCVAAAACCYGLRVGALLATAWVSGAAVEFGVDALRRRKSPKTFITMGLLFVLVLPPGTPLWMAGLGMAFALLVGKEVFGGRYPVSPPLLGLSFLMLSYPVIMTGAYVAPQSGCDISERLRIAPGALVRETPVVLARHGEATPMGKLVWGGAPGAAGETVAAAVLLGGFFLLVTRTIDWRVVLGVLGAFGLLELALSPFPGWAALPPGWNIAAGGLLFGTFFFAGDPATSPATGLGRLAFGVIVGAAAMTLRRFSTTPDDIAVAILLGSILVPFIARLERRAKKGNADGDAQTQ